MHTSKADIESRGIYNFCEMLLAYEVLDLKDRMSSRRDMSNACFSLLNHTEGSMSVQQWNKAKTSTLLKKSVIMFNYYGHRSNACHLEEAKPMFHFSQSITQWNC